MTSKIKYFLSIFPRSRYDLYQSSYKLSNPIRFYGNRSNITVTLNDIKHDPTEKKFYVIVKGLEASIIYNFENDVMRILHTYVPEELGGAGIAGLLSETAFKHVENNNLKMTVLCNYAENYLEKRASHYKKYVEKS